MYRGQDSNFGSIYFEFDAEARAKFVSLIDRMINDCRSEISTTTCPDSSSIQTHSSCETRPPDFTDVLHPEPQPLQPLNHRLLLIPTSRTSLSCPSRTVGFLASSSSPPLSGAVPVRTAELFSFCDELMRCDVEMEKSTHVGSPHSFTQISVPTLMAEVPPKPATVPESGVVIALEAVAQPTGSSTTLIHVAEAEKSP
ncbi:hypothetical protein DY000_02060958 [Brassica cretica]|uniref:IRS-type PTB domain-containing protein n=1 Tax=Brassica cretica TaxID=69181 RepID=A0ABQ7AYI2_BRACR|nr:hypothetical protein DY000_02060958 [Brassica cretica]